jgi:hypothetical protein
MRCRTFAFLPLLALFISGCQCCQCTETIGDVADTVSAHEIEADGLYCPALDLTRIGRRDWCQYPVNRWLCPCRCNQFSTDECP